MSIEIKSRWSDRIIYTHAVEGATIRQAVEAARAACTATCAAPGYRPSQFTQ